ncbi:MAG: hypothetical protein LAO05_16265 [Acidobacteriia bacterium]|nr:hypothetical protein [Terriglobia bacterium]
MTALLLAGALLAAPVPRLGTAVVVERPTVGPVVALLADVHVSSDVVGDVIALGGDVELAPDASVHGDVVALGGRVTGPGKVTGRVASAGGLGLLGSGGSEASGGSLSALGLGLLRAGVWLTLGSLMILAVPRQVRALGLRLASERIRSGVMGVLALLVWLAVVILAVAVTNSPLGVACLLLAVAVLLAAKLAGVVAVAWAVGGAMARVLPVRLRGELARTGVSLFVLLLLALVPVIGTAVWLLVNVVGIGAVVGALLERRPLALVLPSFATR